ncbi:MAG: glutathione S-transferase family protein [Rhodospirillaceae bacterium]|nr:glutathione S-transferase family protein [Rhodospirillaceae bacterium]
MYTLYWAPNSAALAPQICLEEAGRPYELVAVDLAAARDPDYLKLNPGGKVPTLVTDDKQIVTESAAICLLLADRCKHAALLPPSGDPELGSALQWLVFLTNTLQPAILRFYYPERHTTDPSGTQAVIDSAMNDVATLWGRVDRHLAAHGPYFLGERFSAPDAFAFMLSNWQQSCPGIADRFPDVARCAAAVRARPAVRGILAVNELTA